MKLCNSTCNNVSYSAKNIERTSFVLRFLFPAIAPTSLSLDKEVQNPETGSGLSLRRLLLLLECYNKVQISSNVWKKPKLKKYIELIIDH